jgi:hypothetical protein
MIVGGCLCDGVRYEYDGELEEISICHCDSCRKAQGGACAPISPIDSRRFRILKGTELLKEYRVHPFIKARVFCSNCGSPIYSARDDKPEVKRLRIGTIETPFRFKNAYHKYVDCKAEWDDITDSLPQFPDEKP